MFVVQKDVFLITLTRDVSQWYDSFYNGNVISMKALHLIKLFEHYDPDRFRKCNNLNKERTLFLIEIQEEVNREIDLGGSEIWNI